MVRVALRIAYDGTRFSGSQVQPEGIRTVDRDLRRALAANGLDASRVRWAGRTDAGVSAAGNVVVVDAPAADERLLLALTFAMEDAWVWAYAEVPDDFEPRFASRRRYRYFLETSAEEKAVGDALRLFEGTHDFTSFARLEDGVTPRRTVLSTSARRSGRFLVLDVVGENFLWNQVRRMVNAAEGVAAGRVEPATVRAALAGEVVVDLGLAAPEPLVLLDVEYDHVGFTTPDAKMRRRLFMRLAPRLARLDLERALLASLLPEEGAP